MMGDGVNIFISEENSADRFIRHVESMKFEG
jgi:hypothetical protein